MTSDLGPFSTRSWWMLLATMDSVSSESDSSSRKPTNPGGGVRSSTSSRKLTVACRLARGELFAVFRALEIASERGFRRVKIRSDYNYMRKTLKKLYRRQDTQNGTDLQGRVLRLTIAFDEVRFAYTPRRKNHIAHQLANWARKEAPVFHREDLFLLSDLVPRGFHAVRRYR